MRVSDLWVPALVAVLVSSAATPGPVLAQRASAGRGAGKGAAIGAVLGLVLGGDIGSAAEGAAAGAATGAVAGAINRGRQKRDAERAELETLRARELETLKDERSQDLEEERARLLEERGRLAEQRRQLESQIAERQAGSGGSSPETEEDWVAVIGQDNVNAVIALVECQHERATLLAKAGATTGNPDFALASRWIEALVSLDAKDQARATELFEELVIVDDDIDSVQQASLEADKSVLEVREWRREDGIECAR